MIKQLSLQDAQHLVVPHAWCAVLAQPDSRPLRAARRPHPPLERKLHAAPRRPPPPHRPQYRARQTRIKATGSHDLQERSRLLRQSEAALRRCLDADPTDGRPYVSLGKILVMQRRYDEAAGLYEAGAAATGARRGAPGACLRGAGSGGPAQLAGSLGGDGQGRVLWCLSSRAAVP